MNTRNVPGGKGQRPCRADTVTIIFESDV
jgi:hypothetical protein